MITCILLIMAMAFIIWISGEPAEVEEGCSITCKCGNVLTEDGSFISDSYDDNGNNHVLYKCVECGEEHDYNFDIAPVPINWKDLTKKDGE